MDNERLMQLLAVLENSADFRELLNLSSQLRQEAEALGKIASDYARDVLEKIAQLEGINTTQAVEAICDEIIPWCLLDIRDYGDQPEYSMHRYRIQELLTTWLYSFPQYQMIAIRSDVLEFIEAELRRSPSVKLLYLVAAIGYRTQSIRELLWEFISARDGIASEALGVLVGLGVAPVDISRVLDETEYYLSLSKFDKCIIYPVQDLVGPDRIDLAISLVLKAFETSPLRNTWDFHYALGAATLAVSRCNDEDPAQNELWKILRQSPADLEITSNLAYRCNTSLSVADFARWLMEVREGNETGIATFRLFDRLSELVKPIQLAGFSELAFPEFVQFLRGLAMKDTAIKGLYSTIERDLKNHAWELLIGLSSKVVPTDIEQGIFNESNSYVAHDIADIAACLQIEELPVTILDHMQSTEIGEEENSWFFRQGAYLNVARSCGSRRAFEATLNLSPSGKESVLRSTVDTLFSLAQSRLRQGDQDVFDLLSLKSQSTNLSYHKEAAISVYCKLAVKSKDGNQHAKLLFDFAFRDDLDIFTTSEALKAFGEITTVLSDELCRKLVEVARLNNSDLGWRACEIIVRHGKLSRISDDSIVGRLGLELNHGLFSLKDDTNITSWQAFLIGQLFSQSPGEYSELVCHVLSTGSQGCVYQFVQMLFNLGTACPANVIESLCSRMERMNSEGGTDTTFFFVLGSISPDRLLDLCKTETFRNWRVEARVAACNAIDEIAKRESDHIEECKRALAVFALDAAFAVRRSAFRSLGNIDSEALAKLCVQWLSVPDVEIRKRAAEIPEWLPHDCYADKELVAFGFAWDPEPTVREAWKTVVHSRWKRRWADDYLNIVLLACKNGENSSISAAFKYGTAIEVLGDDRTIDLIEKSLRDDSMLPHCEHWLSRILKRLKKNWKKAVKKWPAPWFHEQGHLEDLVGQIVFEDGSQFNASFKLWCRNRVSQSDLGEWGCTAFLEGKIVFSTRPKSVVELRISGRAVAPARIFGSNWEGTKSTLTLLGNGNYPEKLVLT